MRKIILLAHISLDGFVANSNKDLKDFPDGAATLRFVCDLAKEADAALLGRVSYELLNDFWPSAKDSPNATKDEIIFSNWYNAAQKIVLSKTITQNFANTIFINDNIADEITKIKQQAGKAILIFGSPTVSEQLMQLNLIDSYWIFVNPVLFGSGLPLFSSSNKIKFKLLAVKQFSNDEVGLNYVVD